MNGKTVMACIEAAHATLKQNTDEIALLDQQIGDGDHIFNLLRGMEALLAARGEIEAAAFGPSLDVAAAKVLSTVGGSSGPLFFSLLSGMSKSAATHALDVPGFSGIFAAGVDAVGQRGKTGVGSKTMMDVLIPVANRYRELVAAGASARALLDELPRVAHVHMLATRDMLATKGRASFLGERSRGHIDPGARSSELMIAAVCAYLAQRIE